MALGDKTISNLEDHLGKDLKKELREQGHYLTGALEDSVTSQHSQGARGQVLEVFAEGYIDPLNDGVPANKIPYDSSKTTGAEHSKYIEGLTNFAKLRFGLDGKEALGAAFAIAKKHEKEGMPTKGSYAFSNNGKRTESIDRTLSENEIQYDQIIEKGISDEIDQVLDFDFDVLKI
jgi:hypothetical protein